MRGACAKQKNFVERSAKLQRGGKALGVRFRKLDRGDARVVIILHCNKES